MHRFVTALVSLVLIAPWPAIADTVHIRAGTLVDVDASRVLHDQRITIVDGRITAVEPWTETAATGELLNWSDLTVLPGLIDCHTHVIGDIQSDNIAEPLLHSGAQDVLAGVANARATLLAGFTTVRDVGTWRAFTDVALRDAIAAGTIVGPRMQVAGAYVTHSGGSGDITGLALDVGVPAEMRFGVANTPSEVRARVRTLIGGGADFIKVMATGAVLTVATEPGVPELSEEELRAAVEEAAKYGKDVTAHAHGATGIKNALRAGVRSIEHGSLIDDEGIALMKKRGAWLVADIYNGDYIDEVGRRDGWPEEALRKNRETADAQRDGFSKAARAGVRIAFGTDAGVYPHGLNARQMVYMVRYGMTPIEAIQSATISAATLMRIDDKVGSIRVGKFADIIAVKGDPIADISRLEHVDKVMKDGVLVKE